MTKHEFDIQVALGSISLTNGNVIARIMKITTDPELLKFGVKSGNTRVRAVTSRNKHLPIVSLIRLYLIDGTTTVRDSAQISVHERWDEIDDVFKVVTDYPQMSLKLDD